MVTRRKLSSDSSSLWSIPEGGRNVSSEEIVERMAMAAPFVKAFGEVQIMREKQLINRLKGPCDLCKKSS